MIVTFEDITYELTEYERDILLPRIVEGMKKAIGKDRVVKNVTARKVITAQGYKCPDARFRKIIHYIRVHSLIPKLIATSKGYYIATDKEEIKTYVESLTQRVNSINDVITALQNDLQDKPLELDLWTQKDLFSVKENL